MSDSLERVSRAQYEKLRQQLADWKYDLDRLTGEPWRTLKQEVDALEARVAALEAGGLVDGLPTGLEG